MKPLKWIGLLLVLIPAFATIQGKPKKPDKLPAIFDQARYVHVEAVDGQKFDPGLFPEDRQAIVDMEGALRNWGRYVLVLRRDKADLIFVVHKGRQTGAGARGPLDPQGDIARQGCDDPQGGNGRQGRNGPQGANGPQNASGQSDCVDDPATGVALGSEVGPADDLLEIYVRNSDQSRGAPLWVHTRTGGLDRPDLELFKQFKDQVEQDYPPQSSSHAAKP
jgi:hypothetical protein